MRSLADLSGWHHASMSRVLLAALAVLLLGGSTASAGIFPRAKATIDTGARTIRIDVELADSPQQQALGLMHRRTLAREAGMLFRFERPTTGGFWMRNTLIPLSIAFLDGRGRILRILDMTPCRVDPCTVYSPGVAYRSALEVNRGAFGRWGAGRGDTVKLRP